MFGVLILCEVVIADGVYSCPERLQTVTTWCVCLSVQSVRVSVVRTQTVTAYRSRKALLSYHFQKERTQTAKAHGHCNPPHTTPTQHPYTHRHTDHNQHPLTNRPNTISTPTHLKHNICEGSGLSQSATQLGRQISAGVVLAEGRIQDK